jgi:hypothetical protein
MQILLQDGFQHEEITIRVNGREVFHKRNVTSKKLTGMAERIELPEQAGPVSIQVELSKSGNSEEIQVGRDRHVVFFVEDGVLKHSISDQPFGGM